MEKKIKLTTARVSKIPFPETGRVEYFDTDLKGFGLRVSGTKKVYFVLRRVNGKLSRVTIGPANSMKTDQARKEAETIIANLNRGTNVNEEKRKARVRSRSLAEIFEEYVQTRNLKPRTVTEYYKLLNFHLEDWLKRPIGEITGQMVSDRHKKITTASTPAPANNTMRVLRALYNFAIATCDDLPPNPVTRLSTTKQWNKIGRRKTIIPPAELATWFKGASETKNKMIKDYLLLLLITGLRSSEAATLQWAQVDMTSKVFTIIDPKNGRDHTLPMSNIAFEIFQRRSSETQNEYVFPGRSKGHLKEPRATIKKITEETGICFCCHDLRRTFATVAEGQVSYSILKRLLNHAEGNDVTAGYLVHSIEELRDPVQRICNVILRLCKHENIGKALHIGY